MPSSFSSQSKRDALLRAGALHPHPDRVTHSLFQHSPFFDPHDLLQVKYEALRAWEAGEDSVCSLARHFALSRPTLYAARSAFRDDGLPGLLPGKRGPKGAHKLTEEVLDHVRALLAMDPSLTPSDILECLRNDLEVELHLRTLEKALNEQRHLKKGRLTT